MADQKSLAQRDLEVKVFSPYKVYYQGAARSISAVNADGTFDVLPGHISFFSILSPGPVVVDTGNDKVQIPISHGIMHVRHNKSTLFVFGVISSDSDSTPAAKN
jgi:F0F1-type ATP synthase epsilon subunit